MKMKRLNKMVTYKKGNLFSAVGQNTILVHACNCEGKWGAGIAKEFKNRYPEAYKDYKKYCRKYGETLLGMAIQHRGVASDPGQATASLFVSRGYGNQVDPPEKIIKATNSAVGCLLSTLPENVVIHSPKINSGLFNVSWEDTELIINRQLQKTKHEWVVWEL